MLQVWRYLYFENKCILMFIQWGPIWSVCNGVMLLGLSTNRVVGSTLAPLALAHEL
jgi:hypothetical protein